MHKLFEIFARFWTCVIVASLAIAPPALGQGTGDVWPEEGTLAINLGKLEFGPGDHKRTVHYQLEINERGRAKNCRVTRSSGDDLFDESVCKQLRKTARFNRLRGRLFGEVSRYYTGYFWSTPGPNG